MFYKRISDTVLESNTKIKNSITFFAYGKKHKNVFYLPTEIIPNSSRAISTSIN
jgi:hypothetical protein